MAQGTSILDRDPALRLSVRGFRAARAADPAGQVLWLRDVLEGGGPRGARELGPQSLIQRRQP